MKKFLCVVFVLAIMLVGTVAAFADDPKAEPGSGWITPTSVEVKL